MTKNKRLAAFFLPVLVICFYFFSRLQNLTSIPVFGDEAIYVRWSQIIRSVETLRFIPMTDGKQPFFMWVTAGILRFFSDPLLAGRLVSVLAGFGSLLGIFLLAVIIFPSRQKTADPVQFLKNSIIKNFYFGFSSSFIYLILPFTFFFDRMALPDNLLSFFGIYSLFFSLLLAYFPRLDISLILGAVLGLAWLTKSPAIYFVALSVLTFALINFPKYKIKDLFYPVITSGLSFFIYNILRLGPQFHMIAIRNRDYVWGISEILRHPTDPLLPHIRDTFQIYISYISIPILLLSIIGMLIFLLRKPQNKSTIFAISCWWFLPLISNSAIAKVFTARYILYTLPPLIILLSLGIYSLKDYFKKNIHFLIFLFLLPILNYNFIYRLSIHPFSVQLPSTESGYLTDWTSGWGIKESSQYLIQRSKSTNVIVGTEGAFGTLPDGLQIYTDQVNQLTVFGVGLDFKQIPFKLIDARQHGDDVYILINKSRLALTDEEYKKLTLVSEYDKPQNDKLLLLRLN